MKIYLFCAFVCLAHGATIQRITRDTGAIIPTIVEEILKVELQSDLKKNSVEAVESEPLVKDEIKEEIVLKPVESRTSLDGGAALVEEKKPELEEVLVVKEIVPEPVVAVLKTETLPEIKEKVEILAVPEILAEKPLDNFRTESLPTVELVETVKETIIPEPVLELKREPEATVVLKEEEIVRPMTRNVVKEEISQVEELRNSLLKEASAVKEVVPEPIASSNIVEPVVEVEQFTKTVDAEPVKEIKEETPLAPELKKELLVAKVEMPEPVKEMKLEEPLPQVAVLPEVKEEKILLSEPKPEIKAEIVITEIKASPEVKDEIIVSEIKTVVESKPSVETVISPEVKPAVEAVAPVTDEKDLEIRQDRPTIVQAVQDAISNVGQIFNRNPAVADETIADESTASTARPNVVQQVLMNTQQAFQNALNVLSPAAANNAAEAADATTSRPGGPLAAVFQNAVQTIQTAVQSATNLVNPNRPAAAATTAAPASDSDEKPVKVEKEKIPEKEKSVEPVELIKDEKESAVQKEVAEPQKVVVGEEKENVVKN